MKKIAAIALAVLLPTLVLAATFNQFSPATGVLKGSSSTYVTTAATSADIPVAGATTQVLYNNAGVMGADSGLTYNGAGALTMSGRATAGGLAMTTNAATPTNGIYVPSANTVVIATNGANRVTVSSAGLTTIPNISLSGSLVSAGTKFTAVGTGCTIATTVGGAVAGTFTLATGPCTAVVVTMGGSATAATTGWSCQAHDRTSPTTIIGGESASNTTTATITIPAGAGTADVISFSCTGY